MIIIDDVYKRRIEHTFHHISLEWLCVTWIFRGGIVFVIIVIVTCAISDERQVWWCRRMLLFVEYLVRNIICDYVCVCVYVCLTQSPPNSVIGGSSWWIRLGACLAPHEWTIIFCHIIACWWTTNLYHCELVHARKCFSMFWSQLNAYCECELCATKCRVRLVHVWADLIYANTRTHTHTRITHSTRMHIWCVSRRLRFYFRTRRQSHSSTLLPQNAHNRVPTTKTTTNHINAPQISANSFVAF